MYTAGSNPKATREPIVFLASYNNDFIDKMQTVIMELFLVARNRGT